MSENKEIRDRAVKTVGLTTDITERKLTVRNWKFIKYIIEGKKITEAYYMAGYKGKSFSAPYEMVQTLKKEIENIREAMSINKANIMDKTSKLIDKPLIRISRDGLERESNGLTPAEHIKALELARKLAEKEDAKGQQFSPVNIVTSNDGKTQVNFGKGTQDKLEDNTNGDSAERD